MTQIEKDSPRVSVCVICYNQINTIREALESIINQTIFPDIEILIHDDASTDGTIDILKEYECSYPGIIRVIYESKNQYSKHISYLVEILAPLAKGEYIAFCEGDDYWTDKTKLEHQIEFLDNHPNYAQCCHRAAVIDGNTSDPIGTMGYGSKPLTLNTSMLIRNWSMPTASRVVRREAIVNYRNEWSFSSPVGDFPTAIYSSQFGDTFYMPDLMSVYRYRSPGSWTARTGSNVDSLLRNAYSWLQMLSDIDAITNHKYHDDLVKCAATCSNNIYIYSAYSRLKPELNLLCLAAFKSQSFPKRCSAVIRKLVWRMGYSISRNPFKPLAFTISKK